MKIYARIIALCWLCLIAVVSCANNGTTTQDTLTSVPSSIQPRPMLFSGKTRLKTFYPIDSQTVPALSGSGLVFQFDTTSASKASLLVFNSDQAAAALLAGSITASCIGGASTLAGHSWTGLTLSLATTTAASQLYACIPGSAIQPLSVTQKISTANFPSGTYYWLLIGYDANFLMTHSSALMPFTVP